MLDRVRARLSYANVMSTLAAFGVLAGGGAYAASTIGPADIKPNAVRSKHVKNSQVKEPDLHRNNVARRFGGGIHFGRALNFGPVPPATGQGASVPIDGEVNRNSSENSFEDHGRGAHILLPPIPLRARDLRLRASAPVERPVELQVNRVEGLFDTTLAKCRIAAGKRACRRRAPSPKFKLGDRMTLFLHVPIAPQTLSERNYEYSFRLVPG